MAAHSRVAPHTGRIRGWVGCSSRSLSAETDALVYCFDIDGTICSNTDGDYPEAVPVRHVIEQVNSLFDAGHTIKLFTARGATTGIDWRSVTAAQMEEWNVKYHELIMGKPHADVYVDDKAIHISDWLRGVTVPKGHQDNSGELEAAE